MTLKNFLAELSYNQILAIKRHAKGLLIALEKSNRKEMLEYEIVWDKWINKNCENCGAKIEMLDKDYLVYGCRECGAIIP